jgi:hypothetical protein
MAAFMYGDFPYAREVGHVEDAAGAAASIGEMEVLHDVPPDVLASVLHWLHKGGYDKVVGHPKDFKVCPLCKIARYCGEACQKQDWTTGGHKGQCGTARYDE